jgi:outer membrane protein OmpA-like peptidoglycan-associated protein
VSLLHHAGQSSLSPENQAVLDKAARIYREGQPIIMIVAGGTDTVGSPEKNLLLSQARANSVARGLLERGIPAERCQILAKGETTPPVKTARGVPEAQNRRFEISWR